MWEQLEGFSIVPVPMSQIGVSQTTHASGVTNVCLGSGSIKRRKVSAKYLSSDPKNVKRRQGYVRAAEYAAAGGPPRKRGRPLGPSTPLLEQRNRHYAEKRRALKSATLMQQSETDFLNVLNTSSGRKQFPEIASKLQSEEVKDVVAAAAYNLVQTSGRAVKPQLVRNLASKLSSRQTSKFFKIPLQCFPPNVTREKHNAVEDALCVQFFKDKCASSDSYSRESSTLVMRKTFQDMEQEFYASYPALLQIACKANPELLPHALSCAKPTRFERAIIAVNNPDNRFDYDLRLQLARKRYAAKLEKCASRLATITRVKPISKTFDEDELVNDPSHIVLDEDQAQSQNDVDNLVCPLSQRAFLQALHRAGVKYTTKFHPHECPIHTKGEQHYQLQVTIAKDNELRLLHQKVECEQNGVEWLQVNSIQLSTAQAELKHANSELEGFYRHIKQYEQCRKYISQLEEALSIVTL